MTVATLTLGPVPVVVPPEVQPEQDDGGEPLLVRGGGWPPLQGRGGRRAAVAPPLQRSCVPDAVCDMCYVLPSPIKYDNLDKPPFAFFLSPHLLVQPIPHVYKQKHPFIFVSEPILPWTSWISMYIDDQIVKL